MTRLIEIVEKNKLNDLSFIVANDGDNLISIKFKYGLLVAFGLFKLIEHEATFKLEKTDKLNKAGIDDLVAFSSMLYSIVTEFEKTK